MTRLDSSCFALPVARKFRINTEHSTAESIRAYNATKDSYSSGLQAIIEGNLTKAAAFYGLNMKKEAKADENDTLDGKIVFKGSTACVVTSEVRSKEDLDKLASYVVEKRASTLREDLEEAAKYVLWGANELDVDLDTDTMRKIAHIAGIGVGDREKIQYELEKRGVTFAMSDPERMKLWKLASETKKMTDEQFYEPDNLIKLCSFIDNMDNRHGSLCLHGNRLKYPEDVIFGDTLDDLIKEASDLHYLEKSDTLISKKAAEISEKSINSFFSRHFSGHEYASGDKLLEKLGNLDENGMASLEKWLNRDLNRVHSTETGR